MLTHQIATYFPDCPSAELISDGEEYDKSKGCPNELEIYFPEEKGELKIVGDGQVVIKFSIKQPEHFKCYKTK